MTRGTRTILVTGATGALGPTLLGELLASGQWDRVAVVARKPQELPADDRIIAIQGDVRDAAVADARLASRDVEVVLHAAADTRFRATPQEQDAVNVQGTANVLGWARGFANLRRFVFTSTTCVAGARTGRIEETISSDPPQFLNPYEASKWHAEQLVAASGIPSLIVRLSTAVGSERDGRVHREGAIHHALRWMHRGLVPMLPGAAGTPVDLISTELAAGCLARCATLAGNAGGVVHVAAGDRAIPLGELVDCVAGEFRDLSPAWRQRQIPAPMIVDRQTFEMFRQSVRRSGDVLFRTVLDSTAAFLPGLLYPKTYDTRRAEALSGGPLPVGDWRRLVCRVVRQCVRPDAPVVARQPEVCHA